MGNKIVSIEPGSLHHIEFYVRELAVSIQFWGWFLRRYGYVEYQEWSLG